MWPSTPPLFARRSGYTRSIKLAHGLRPGVVGL